MLTSFADECIGVLARLLAYIGTLALVGVFGLHLWRELQLDEPNQAAVTPGWSVASRSRPAFAVNQLDLAGKTETYQIFRHPAGGRKDVLRWLSPAEKPVAELEIYRAGNELDQPALDFAAIAARMETGIPPHLEPAGVIDSKFGSITLLRGTRDPHSCLAFIKRLDETRLQISGWSCQGDTLAARRSAIACVLNRLVLLTAGNDPKLAEIFARAELKGGSCAGSATAAADWVTSAGNPGLRGAI